MSVKIVEKPLSWFVREYRITPIRAIYVNDIAGEGYMHVEFKGDVQYNIKFASASVLWNWLMRKQYLQGVRLYWNGVSYTIHYGLEGRK